MESVEKHIEVDKKILEDPYYPTHNNVATLKKNFMNLKFMLKIIKKRLQQEIITTLQHLNFIVK